MGFLGLACGITWLTFGIRQAVDFTGGVHRAMTLVMKFGPSVAGLVMAWAVGGWPGVRGVVGRLLTLRVHVIWYLVALLVPPLIIVVALVIYVMLGSHALDSAVFRFASTVGVFSTFLAIRFFAGGGLGEELGWRGFMLPHTQGRVGALRASVGIGLFHGLWHLPAYGVATILLTMFTVAGSIVFTWMYNRTEGNLLLPALMHASANASIASIEVIVPALDNDAVFVLISFVIWGCVAAAIIKTVGRESL